MRPARLFFAFWRHFHIVMANLFVTVRLGQGIFRSPDIALAKCAGFDCKRVMHDVAIHMGTGEHLNPQSADWADHPALHGNLVARNLTMDRSLRADHNCRRTHIPLDGAFDLQVSAGHDVALYHDIGADDRRADARGTCL